MNMTQRALLTGLLLLTATADAHEYYADGFTIVHPWALPTAEGETTANAYVVFDEISKNDRLLSARSPIAGVVEFVEETNGTSPDPWRVVPTIDLPVGATVKLKPQGAHMLMLNLSSPLRYDRAYPLTLVFEKAGVIETTLSVGQH